MSTYNRNKKLCSQLNIGNYNGFITVKNFRLLLGVADYHARQVLDGYCEGEFPKMVREKVGATYLYRVIGE